MLDRNAGEMLRSEYERSMAEVWLLFRTGDHYQRLAQIYLRLAGRMSRPANTPCLRSATACS